MGDNCALAGLRVPSARVARGLSVQTPLISGACIRSLFVCLCVCVRMHAHANKYTRNGDRRLILSGVNASKMGGQPARQPAGWQCACTPLTIRLW